MNTLPTPARAAQPRRASIRLSDVDLLLSVEGGGTHSQAALLDRLGRVVQMAESGDTNENFTSRERARQAVTAGVDAVLGGSGVEAGRVRQVACAFLSPHLVRDVLFPYFPQAAFHYYGERDVVFVRAGHYRPHGVGVVAATGATAWAVRRDDGRQAIFGGWGSLLGDEGSAYAMGLLGLRAAARSFEGRESPICPTSGIGAASVLWGMAAGIVEEMLARGLSPAVYPSINLPDGPDRVALAEAKASQRGY